MQRTLEYESKLNKIKTLGYRILKSSGELSGAFLMIYFPYRWTEKFSVNEQTELLKSIYQYNFREAKHRKKFLKVEGDLTCSNCNKRTSFLFTLDLFCEECLRKNNQKAYNELIADKL